MALKVTDYNDLCTKLRGANWRKIIKRIQLEFSKLTMVGDVRALDNWNMEFENVVLFLQHGLLYQEFSNAIHFDDPGRVEHCLKIFSIWFQSPSNSSGLYASELLHMVACLNELWSEEFR